MNTTFITGIMKGGKSEELIKRIKRTRQEGSTFLVVKPITDTRDGGFVTSRATKEKEEAIVIDESSDMQVRMLFDSMDSYAVVFIDEVQFFSRQFMEDLIFIAEMENVDLVISGLYEDFKGEVFESSQLVKDVATWKMYKRGYCDDCEGIAHKHIRVIDGEVQTEGDSVAVETGNVEYLTVCNNCLGKRLAK